MLSNTGFNAAGRAWTLVMSLVLTPYILHQVGDARFGIWVLAGVVCRHFGMVDFCLGHAFVTFIAEDAARGRQEGVNRTLAAGQAFYIVLAAVVVGIAWPLIPSLLDVLHVAEADRPEAVFVFRVALILFALMNVLRVYPAVCDGLQRMDVMNVAGMGTTLIWIGGTVVSLEMGYGLRGLSLSQLASYVVYIVIIAVAAHRFAPGLRVRPWRADRGTARRLLGFGARVQVERLAELVNMHLDKLLVAPVLGVALVPLYELPSKIGAAVRSLPATVAGPLVPAMAALRGGGDDAGAGSMFRDVLRVVAVAGAGASAFLAVAAPDVIMAWVGPGYLRAARVLQILAPAGYCAALAAVLGAAAQAVQRPDILMRQGLVQLGANVVLSGGLLVVLGFYGPAWGTTLAAAIGLGYFVRTWRTAMGASSFLPPARLMLLPVACALLAAAPAWAWTVFEGGAACGRMHAFYRLGVQAPVFAVLFVAGLFLTGCVRRDDLARWLRRRTAA